MRSAKSEVRSAKSKVRSAKSLDNQLLWDTLLEAADQFIVKRGESLKTVIAGYHWFTDWARDTMISLPGLCLSTGRHDDAKKILAAFAQSISEGMLPNRFQDGGDVPEYNNVDGTLWFFVAVYKYWLQTKDNDFVLHEMLPKLQDIVDWHYKGTRYNIHVAEDGLLYAGETGQQLTWMDARVGDWVVTPRMGKPVEIQALWYNALMILSELYAQTGNGKAEFNIFAEKYKAMGQSVKTAFDALFWYNTGGYYYDVIDEHNVPDPSVRPNTLFAICLPFPIANGDKAQSTFQKIKEELYTPVGLRSLSPKDDRYIGSYGGGQYERDSAYHQGTVWSWLLGPYIDAVIQLDSQNGRSEANTILGNFAYHLHEACIGSVSEIFEGNAPHTPQGCIAQAWSVAELLRVIHDHQL